MQVLVNGYEVEFNEVEAIADIASIARQFTLVDVSDEMAFKNGDEVEIYDNSGVLFIKGAIEYIESNTDNEKSEYIYAGRNNAKFIVDCYADTTTQFTQNQKANTVIANIATQFGLKVSGDAQLPQQGIKTILIGEKIIDALLEIVHSAEKILISDALGNLQIEFEATEQGAQILEYGVNINSRNFIDNTTGNYDKYTIIAQSNYLVEQSQNVYVTGSFGSGSFHKVIVVKHTLTAMECEKLAEFEYKKDMRKSYSYKAKISDVNLELNKKYLVKDDKVKIDEFMNCKAIRIFHSATESYTEVTFEKVV